MPEFNERTPGTYRSKFVALDERYPITPRETGVEEIRWRWVFQHNDPRDADPVIDAIASPGFKARSNNLKFLTGMLGRPPVVGDNTDSLLGQDFDVQYGPNMNGRNTIVGVLRVNPVASQDVAGLGASAAAQHAIQEGYAQPQTALPNMAPESATFRDTQVPVTDPTGDDLPF